MACINIDAHLDVRPLKNGQVHSGSPFRLLLEDKRFSATNFVEFAAQGMQCSAEHAEWLQARGGRIVWLKGARCCFLLVRLLLTRCQTCWPVGRRPVLLLRSNRFLSMRASLCRSTWIACAGGRAAVCLVLSLTCAK